VRIRILVDAEAEDFTRMRGRDGVVVDEDSVGLSGLGVVGLAREARFSFNLTILKGKKGMGKVNGDVPEEVVTG